MNKAEAVEYCRHIGGESMHHLDLEWLWDHASKYKTVCEIGALVGRTTSLLSHAVRQNGGTVYAVDMWRWEVVEGDDHYMDLRDDLLLRFRANTQELPNLVTVICDSAEAAKHLPDMDMSFIDACHDNDMAIRDIEAWLHKTRYLLCGHDANMGPVRRAVVKTLGREAIIGPGAIWAKELR